MAARSKAGDAADTKATMLRAAEIIVNEHGLEALTIRRVCKASEASVGMVSHLFGSMDGLVLAVNARTLDQLAAAFDAMPAGSDLLAAALLYFRYAVSRRHRWDALFQHRMRDAVPVPDWFIKHRTIVLDRVASLLGGEDKTADAALRARTVFEAVHGIVLLGIDQKLGGEAADVEQRLACLAGAFSQIRPARRVPASRS